jgi:ABC-type multidrug transport system fused ATPase/permease subunit
VIQDRPLAQIISRILNLLNKEEKKKLFFACTLQILLGFFDLLGIALIGLLGAISARSIQSLQPGSRATLILDRLNLFDLPIRSQTIILATLAVVAFFAKSILSIYSSKKILKFISGRMVSISNKLISKVFLQPLIFVNQKTSQETYYAVSEGVSNITFKILGSFILLISDFSLLLLIGVSLLFVDPLVAIGAFIGFGLVAFMLYRLTEKQSLELGKQGAKYHIYGNEKKETLNLKDFKKK